MKKIQVNDDGDSFQVFPNIIPEILRDWWLLWNIYKHIFLKIR